MAFNHRGRARAARALAFALTGAALASAPVAAQDFGFGDAAVADAADQAPSASVRLGGHADYAIRIAPYFLDLDSSSIYSEPGVSLELGAFGKGIAAFASLDIDPGVLADSPEEILRQAWASADLGPLSLKAGLQRVSWGAADSLRVNDVLSPHDYRSLAFRDMDDQYLPQTSLSGKLALGRDAYVQAVWTPFFEGDQYSVLGDWAPKKISSLIVRAYLAFYDIAYGECYDQAYAAAYARLYAAAYETAIGLGATAEEAADAAAAAAVENAAEEVAANDGAVRARASEEAKSRTESLISFPDTSTLEYGQIGARFTIKLAGADLGAQYWYGFDRRPSYDADPEAIMAAGGTAKLSYDRLHHIGADAAFSLSGFNFRLEAAANLTRDADGSNRLVHNRNIAWSAGVDRTFFGVTVNLQGTQAFILGAGGIASAYDVEYGAKGIDTKIALALDRSFFRERLKAQLAAIWEIAQEDCVLNSSLAYSVSDDAELRLRGCAFLGDPNGNFGQFSDNGFVEASIRYSF